MYLSPEYTVLGQYKRYKLNLERTGGVSRFLICQDEVTYSHEIHKNYYSC